MAETETKDRKTQIGLAQAVAAHAYGVALSEMGRPDRATAQARRVAMYLARVPLQLGLRETARGFGRNHKAVAHACRRVEEAREDPAFDRTLAWLESAVRRAAGVTA